MLFEPFTCLISLNIICMEAIVHVLLYIHIAFGSLALLAGPASLLVAKGQKLHRFFGQVFAYSMILNGVAALIISMSP